MSEEKIHIAIAESAPIVSTGLSHIVSRIPGLLVRAMEVKTPANLKSCLTTQHPDILIVNPFFGGMFDIDGSRALVPEMKIIAIAALPLDRKRKESFDDTISIADDVDTIAEKIKKLSSKAETPTDSKEPLSNREKEIIAHVVKGMTNKEIADRLFLSVHTVITHRRNIARKLEIHSATGLTIYAIVNKIVDIAELNL